MLKPTNFHVSHYRDSLLSAAPVLRVIHFVNPVFSFLFEIV